MTGVVKGLVKGYAKVLHVVGRRQSFTEEIKFDFFRCMAEQLVNSKECKLGLVRVDQKLVRAAPSCYLGNV